VLCQFDSRIHCVDSDVGEGQFFSWPKARPKARPKDNPVANGRYSALYISSRYLGEVPC